MDGKQKNETPTPQNVKKTEDHTYDDENTVGSDGGGVGASRETWGGELPPPSDDDRNEQCETD